MKLAEKKLLNVRETARLLGVHENTVRNWEKNGILPAMRLPGSGYRRFDYEQIMQMQKEMFHQLAPASTGPVVETNTRFTGRVVHGDLPFEDLED